MLFLCVGKVINLFNILVYTVDQVWQGLQQSLVLKIFTYHLPLGCYFTLNLVKLAQCFYLRGLNTVLLTLIRDLSQLSVGFLTPFSKFYIGESEGILSFVHINEVRIPL